MSANPTYARPVLDGLFTLVELEAKGGGFYEWTLRNRLDGSVLEVGDADEKPDAIEAARLHFDRHEARLAAELERAQQVEEARKLEAMRASLQRTKARSLVLPKEKWAKTSERDWFRLTPPPADVRPTRSYDDAAGEAGKAEIWAELVTDAIERLRYVESDARTCESVPDECTARRTADLRLKLRASLRHPDLRLAGGVLHLDGPIAELVSAFQIGDFVEPLEAKVSEWRGLKPAERSKIAWVYASCERALVEGKTLTPFAIETYRSRDWGMETPTDAPDSTIKGAFGKAKDIAANWHPMIADMVSEATGEARGRGGGRRKTT